MLQNTFQEIRKIESYKERRNYLRHVNTGSFSMIRSFSKVPSVLFSCIKWLKENQFKEKSFDSLPLESQYLTTISWRDWGKANKSTRR